MAQEAVAAMLLPPKDYEGDPGTAVVGRRVLSRGPLNIKARSGDGKGAQKGKHNKGIEDTFKSEHHFLGGDGPGQILYVEAWGRTATDLCALLTVGRVYSIAGGAVVNSAPEFSTSTLHYYMKALPPLGLKTRINLCESAAWQQLPQQHPFVEVSKCPKVLPRAQVCLLGIISDQPGLVPRATKYGPSAVCNAWLRQGTHSISCEFWREAGGELAQFGAGTAVALMQVALRKDGTSFRVTATRATQVLRCPGSLKAGLEAATDLATQAVRLTEDPTVDYDTTTAKLVTVSALASIAVPNAPRTLRGVYEAHVVAVSGVAAVSSDDKWVMTSCSKCKAMLRDGEQRCRNHPDQATEPRWLLALNISDGTGCIQRAIAYHDAVSKLPDLPDVSSLNPHEDISDAQKKKLLGLLRSMPWSIRALLKVNDLKATNDIEIKRLAPTINEEGILQTCRFRPAPHVASDAPGTPVARCAAIAIDSDLGSPVIDGQEVTAVRILVCIQELGDDEECATPDESKKGFRVVRRVKCALSEGEAAHATYPVAKSGVSSSVQWLMAAPGGAQYFLGVVPVADQAGGIYFSVVSHLSTAKYGDADFRRFLLAHLSAAGVGPVIEHPTTATPSKRQREVDASTHSSGPDDVFSKRCKVQDHFVSGEQAT